MRLPPSLLNSQFFLFSSLEELLTAVGEAVPSVERDEVIRLARLGLPPASSRDVLAAMLGVNPGLIWFFEHRPAKNYRRFTIPKGSGRSREIVAPRVALKILQKWLSVQLQCIYTPPDHVFGFVPGRSHISAAKQHLNAQWTYSVDIANFFPSTPKDTVAKVLQEIGYGPDASQMIARICCFNGALAQGAPSSPVLSNLAFKCVDARLVQVAAMFGARLSRYADDIVFSGVEPFPEKIVEEVNGILKGTPWVFSPQKIEICKLPRRLKVHGLLVHGSEVRLTKGYRNKLRAYAHLLDRQLIRDGDRQRISGHLRYGRQIEEAADE